MLDFQTIRCASLAPVWSRSSPVEAHHFETSCLVAQAASGARWATAAKKHREREAKAMAKGNERSAAMARKAAETAEKHARANGNKVEALQIPAARARVTRRLNYESADSILAKAVTLAVETPPEAPLPKPDRKTALQAEKLRRQRQVAQAEEAARARKAGIDHDPRTAAAQREIVVAKRRGADPREAVAVASFADYISLIRNRSERTVERIRAMQAFDELCHRAFAGLFPEPRFERGVDRSRSIPGVADDRSDSLREMQNLTNRIGQEAQALCFHRIFERRTFAWMEGQGMGDAEVLGALFLRAVDAVGRFYGFGQASRAIEAMEAAIARTQAPNAL